MPSTKNVQFLSKDYSQHYIADYKPFNFVDGEGVRNSLYVSGCLFNCKGCFNKAAQNFHYGTPFTKELLTRILQDLEPDYIQGLTLLGGEPFMNTEVCTQVVKAIRERFGQKKDIWSWTGYTFEELLNESDDKLELLSLIDILVDGPFILKKKDLTLQFRGSSNQRIITVPESLVHNKAIIWPKCIDPERI